MSAKKHILVPHHFSTESLASNFSAEQFPHVTTTERDAMLRSGSIEALGSSGRVWRVKPSFAVRGFSARYGEHLARIKHTAIGALMLSETTRRPMAEAN